MGSDVYSVAVSVIVPVYNASKYLRRCLDSIRYQTFNDFEVVLVNDASTDDSLEILKEYCEQDFRIKLVSHNFNKGLPTARKTGLQHAVGEYIFFIDSDDWIEPDTLELMYECAMSGDKDIVFSEYDRVDINGDVEFVFELKKECFEKVNMGEADRIDLFVNEPINFWGKLYRKKWFGDTGISFMEGASFDEDDIEVLFSLFANKVGRILRPLYHYFDNPGSMSNKTGFHIGEREASARYIVLEAKRLGIYEKYKEAIDYVYYRCFVFWAMLAIIDSKTIRCEALQELIERIGDKNQEYLQNKYIMSRHNTMEKNMLSSLDTVENFARAYCEEFKELYLSRSKQIEQVIRKSKGKVVLWSAGKRTRTIVLTFPSDIIDCIDCVVDIDERLKGHRLENTLTIMSVEDIDASIETILVPRSDWVQDVKKIVGDKRAVFDISCI